MGTERKVGKLTFYEQQKLMCGIKRLQLQTSYLNTPFSEKMMMLLNSAHCAFKMKMYISYSISDPVG